MPFLTPDSREDMIMTDETVVVSPYANGESSKLIHTSFFNRGSSLFSSVRSSLRKIGYRPHKKDTVVDLEPLISPSPIEVISTTLQEINASLNLKLEDMKSNDSHDSGLGEDSDLGEASVVTSPRTPPPCTIPGSLLFLLSIYTNHSFEQSLITRFWVGYSKKPVFGCMLRSTKIEFATF
jgi:hypothetical protein